MEHLQSIQQIFSDKLLKVPDYQRGYAWEKKHWEDLIEDLEVLLKGQEHYTGTLVLYLDKSRDTITDEEGSILKVYDIVDGQQRLTTLVILLHCISKQMRQQLGKTTFSEGINKKYVKFIDYEGQENSRLSLNKDCHEFFIRNILSEQPTLVGLKIKSHERLEQALYYFDEYLQQRKRDKSEEYESWLKDLHEKITNKLRLTVYNVPSASEVGVIFEVMNNRGKSLSEMEKVKNYLLYLSSKIEMDAADKLGERINSVWASVFERLMESGVSSTEYENQLLRTSWIMAYNYFAKEWKGYSSIKERFNLKRYANNHSLLLEDLKKYVEVLYQSCEAYCDILAPNHDESFKNFHDRPQVRKILRKKTEKLARIGNRVPFLPVLMAARIQFPNNSEFFEELLDLCEKYAFRIYRMQRSRSNTGQSNLFKLGYSLFRLEINKKDVLSSIRKNLLFYSPELTFRDFFFEIGRDWYNFYGLKYFLYEYEDHLSRGKGVRLPWDKLVKKDKMESIEHILPQAPIKPYWREMWDKKNIETYLHDIGNLTLTFDNSVYSNKPFSDKKGAPGQPNCYMTSPLFQEKEVAVYSDWTLDELLQRRKKIIEWALERWRVDGEHVDEIESDEEDYDEQDIGAAEDLIDTFYEDEVKDEDLVNIVGVREWNHKEINEYLDYLKSWGELTFQYFKELASIEGKIGYNELIKRMQNALGKEFHGKKIAGVFAGLTRRAAKRGGERLDCFWEEGNFFSLNNKYKKVIQQYFQEDFKNIKRDVP